MIINSKKDNILLWCYKHGLLFVIIMVMLILMPYIIIFASNGISTKSSDWSAFGGYVGGTLVFVSIFLLLLTLHEQHKTNYLAHFEKTMFYHLDIIAKLQDKHRELIDDLFQQIITPFLAFSGFGKCEDISKKDARNAISYIYSHFVNIVLENNSQEEIFHYIEFIANHIDRAFQIEDKEVYAMDLRLAVSEKVKVLLFFYLITNDKEDTLHLCDKYKFFMDWEIDNDMLYSVVSLFCKHTKPIQEIDPSSMRIDLFSIDEHTTFYEVIDHLNNKQ